MIEVSKNVLEEIRYSDENFAELGTELGLKGLVRVLLTSEDGDIKHEGLLQNIITYIGDRYYAERAANVGTPPNQVTGMKLGTGTTAVSKTGAGAALVTYKSGSQVAITGGYPQAADQGTGRRIIWRAAWGAGIATDSALGEAVIVNETLTDATSLAAATIARVLLSPTINKGSGDTLDLTWNHDIDTA